MCCSFLLLLFVCLFKVPWFVFYFLCCLHCLAAGAPGQPRWHSHGLLMRRQTAQQLPLVLFTPSLAGGEFSPLSQGRERENEWERGQLFWKWPFQSGSDCAAVRNYDWRWRIRLSWRDMPDYEMEKRSLTLHWLYNKLCAALYFVNVFFKKFVSFSIAVEN